MNGSVRRILLIFVVSLGHTAIGQGVPTPKIPEPQWQRALAYGGAPDCPKHVGKRTYRSDVAAYSNTTVFITGTTTHSNSGCTTSTEIQVNQRGRANYFKLIAPNASNFSLVDFSPDGSHVLLAHNYREDHIRQYREVSIGLMPLANGQIDWRNTWDFFGWKDCDAMVEPQGFLPDGRIVIRARKSILSGNTHPNCVNDIGLYALDLTRGPATRLLDSTKIVRFGTHKSPGFQVCKSDPDIVGACFIVHGRLSAWNGTPTMRIWRIGTSRILGVHDGIMPESLTSRMNWDTEAYGDFDVCPFTKERAGEMRMVCVANAENVVIKKR